jgi:hypothetical protein
MTFAGGIAACPKKIEPLKRHRRNPIVSFLETPKNSSRAVKAFALLGA